MFDKKSRYYNLKPYQVTDNRGRKVVVFPVPDVPRQSLLGRHLVKQGQRIDHLAYKYLDEPAGFWRICEVNNVMLPEQLSEASEIIIPVKTRK